MQRRRPLSAALDSTRCDDDELGERTTRAAGLLTLSLRTVLSSSRPAVRRLARAGTSVAFHLGESGAGATLLLDRRPPEVIDGAEPAEIDIVLTPEQARAFANGSISLPIALVSREVGFRGPVRKYLAVDPIMRALLAELAREP